MNINRQETTVLAVKKYKEGKSTSQVYSEIDNLKGFEYDLTIKNKDISKLKERLNKANEEIISLKEQLKLKKQKTFKDNFKELQKSEDLKDKVYDLATTKDLNRIISLLQVEKKMKLCDLTKTCGIQTKIRDNAISFLSKNNLIKVIPGCTTWIEWNDSQKEQMLN